MENEFINGIQDADIFLHNNNQAAQRGEKVIAILTRAICSENGIHGLTVDRVGRSLVMTADGFPGESFIVRTDLAGVEFIRRDDRRHEGKTLLSSGFEPEAIHGFMKKLGRHLRLIDAGHEPV